MILTFVSKVDRKGKPRSAENTRGETPLRYLATVVHTHEEKDLDITFVTQVDERWALGFESELVRKSGRRTKKHKAGITRQMIKNLLDILDQTLRGHPKLALVIKTAMVSTFSSEFRRSKLFLKSG